MFVVVEVVVAAVVVELTEMPLFAKTCRIALFKSAAELG